MINEGNILKNFTYLFSTGSSLDSLTLSGKVIVAETGKIDSTLIVMLHRNADDLAVIKKNPGILPALIIMAITPSKTCSSRFIFLCMPER